MAMLQLRRARGGAEVTMLAWRVQATSRHSYEFKCNFPLMAKASVRLLTPFFSPHQTAFSQHTA